MAIFNKDIFLDDVKKNSVKEEYTFDGVYMELKVKLEITQLPNRKWKWSVTPLRGRDVIVWLTWSERKSYRSGVCDSPEKVVEDLIRLGW